MHIVDSVVRACFMCIRNGTATTTTTTITAAAATAAADNGDGIVYGLPGIVERRALISRAWRRGCMTNPGVPGCARRILTYTTTMYPVLGVLLLHCLHSDTIIHTYLVCILYIEAYVDV